MRYGRHLHLSSVYSPAFIIIILLSLLTTASTHHCNPCPCHMPGFSYAPVVSVHASTSYLTPCPNAKNEPSYGERCQNDNKGKNEVLYTQQIRTIAPSHFLEFLFRTNYLLGIRGCCETFAKVLFLFLNFQGSF